MNNPRIIQGGMGVGVSHWKLARAVSQNGQLGVVSGTALDMVFARRLQDGDPEGSIRRAVDAFPFPEIAQRYWERYFIEGGKAPEAPYKAVPMYSVNPTQDLLELTILANFVEVYLAKEGHTGVVGINFLEKIQMPLLPSIFGAMCADVDYVLMGAGIPREIPRVLDAYSQNQAASLKINVEDASKETEVRMHFDPSPYLNRLERQLKRPRFLAVIASATLALTLAKKASGEVNGFVVEGPSAGGHNAPPRGEWQLNERGEPVYGERDQVDLKKIAALGKPFWLAGAYGSSNKLKEAIELGAEGIQVGTAFAFCNESGLTTEYKKEVLKLVREGKADVFTDPRVSASGFPFKVVSVEGSLSEDHVFEERERICDLGYLRHVYERPDGKIAYRCPGEPESVYLKKGGKIEETQGRKCLCNALVSAIGLPQQRKTGYTEPPLLTAGDTLAAIGQFIPKGQETYSAQDVIAALTAGLPAET